MNFKTWINTFVEEKGLDMEKRFDVQAPDGTPHSVPVGCVVEAMISAGKDEQAQIKTTIVKIDFMNGDVLHFFNHLASGLAASF